MKLSKASFFSGLGLSVIHFTLVLAGTQFRPEILSSGTAGTVTDNIERVLVQPGVRVAEFMGCITEKPMWWIFLILNSMLWGNAIAYLLRMFFKGSPEK